MMNMILSVIVCFAMIFGGTGTMPAQPETAATWTVKNITIDNGAESVTLTPEVRLTTAMGSEKAALHFEVGSGEQTILPATGEITADGVRFALGNNGRSYSISDDALMELAQMGQEDTEMIAVMADFFKTYGTVLGKAMYDAEFAAQFGEASMQAMLDACQTSVTETEAEIEGVTYPAQQLSIELTGKAVMGMLDSLLTCGIPEVEAMIQGCIDLVNATGEMEITSLGEMAADMEEDIVMPMNVVVVEQDDFTYESATMEMTEGEIGMIMSVSSEYIMRAEETRTNMVMTMGDDTTAMTCEMSAVMTGPAAAPTAVDMSCGVYAVEDYSYAAETEDEEDYTSVYEVSMFVNYSGATADGLDNMVMSAMMDTLDTYGYGEDVESYGESFAIDMSCNEAAEADGSVTSSWNIEAGMGPQAWNVSFDVNRAEGAVQDYFAGCTDYALTSEVLASADGEQASQELMLLGTDAMSYVAEAYALTMDESVVSLMDMFTVVEEEAMETVEEYEEVESTTVYSLEEAAGIYEGAIPDFTAPEGYGLTEIIVDAYTLDAFYTGAENSFEMYLYDYTNEDSRYYGLADGVLTPVEGDLVEIYEYDGYAQYAEVSRADCEATFYFYDMELAQAEIILAGLK